MPDPVGTVQPSGPSTAEARPRAANLRLAVVAMSAGSLFVPLAGLLTAPLLAKALSPEGRGELAAALAPAVLMMAVATLGLPEALTYHLARRPGITRIALLWAGLTTAALGLLCVVLVWLVAPLLSGGDGELAHLMLVAAAVTVPALGLNVLRGAAAGHQMWVRVAIEKLVVSTWRLVWFVALFATGRLTVLAAVLVTVSAPLGALAVYAPLLTARSGTKAGRDPDSHPTAPMDGPDDVDETRVMQPLLSFGLRMWVGAVSMMLLARTSDLLMVPLASTTELGLWAVAVTVADVPVLFAFAMQSALFGVNSKTRDAGLAVATSRLTILVALLGCSVLAASLPFILVPLFGAEFSAALGPTLLIMLRTVYGIPGLLAGGALAAWGHPGRRSVGLIAALTTNVVGFVVLVPPYGLWGAVIATFVTATVSNLVMIGSARRVIGVRGRQFWLVERTDVCRLRAETARLARAALVRSGLVRR